MKSFKLIPFFVISVLCILSPDTSAQTNNTSSDHEHTRYIWKKIYNTPNQAYMNNWSLEKQTIHLDDSDHGHEHIDIPVQEVIIPSLNYHMEVFNDKLRVAAFDGNRLDNTILNNIDFKLVSGNESQILVPQKINGQLFLDLNDYVNEEIIIQIIAKNSDLLINKTISYE